MDTLYVDFPVSGVHTLIFWPPLVAFLVSFFSSMGGVSGAFFLVPYQVSVLHFVSPSVSSTNFVYNVVAIPSGIWRYIREERMAWPLAGIIIIGTLPGVFLGYYLRVLYLPDPKIFRIFVGCVLLYIALHLLHGIVHDYRKGGISQNPSKENIIPNSPKNLPADAAVRSVTFSLWKIEYAFGGETFFVRTPGIVFVAFLVGIIGGAYGIGGGSILAPFCITVYKLPVYTVAGAALLGTFMTSIAGVIFYSLIPVQSGISTSPDWLLGILFGIGGMLGMYCGARFQKYVPKAYIKGMLALIMLFVSCRYILT